MHRQFEAMVKIHVRRVSIALTATHAAARVWAVTQQTSNTPATPDNPPSRPVHPGTSEQLVIRTMSTDELSVALTWAADEGWNPGLSDAQSFHAADPSGFFLGEINGDPVGCISAVRYCDDFGFLGLYIVHPGHRRRGYGMALWNHAMQYLAGCNIGLDGVLAQQANYARSGFKLAHRNIRYETPPGPHSTAGAIHPRQGTSNCNIVSVDSIIPGALAAYDRQMFLFERPQFLKQWTTQPGATAFAAVNTDAQVQGYAVMRPCGHGYKIGPLFANTKSIAEDLFNSCKAAAGGATIYLDIPESNHAALDLVTRHGMKPMFETARMYTKADPGLPLDRIYGISTFELG